MTSPSMIVPLMVLLAIGVAEGPNTNPDEVTLPPVGDDVPATLPDVALAIEEPKEVLCKADVANGLPDVGPMEDPGATVEGEPREAGSVDIVAAVPELLACRLNTA